MGLVGLGSCPRAIVSEGWVVGRWVAGGAAAGIHRIHIMGGRFKRWIPENKGKSKGHVEVEQVHRPGDHEGEHGIHTCEKNGVNRA